MKTAFWELASQYVVEIRAPQYILNCLDRLILLRRVQPKEVARVVYLQWDRSVYRKICSSLWLSDYAENDIVWQESHSGWLMLGHGFFLEHSPTSNSARFYITANRQEDVLVYGYPLLNLLLQVLKPLGYTALHAAVIGAGGQFALIPGKQNTGKSTTSATWVTQGGKFVTDDFCFVKASDPTLAHGFYPTLRLRKKALTLLEGHMSGYMLRQKADSKYFLSLLPHHTGQFVPQVKLKLILCLSLDQPRLSHSHVGPQVGFEYLASSVAFSAQYRGDNRLSLQAIKTLVRELPIFQVNLSPNIVENYHYLHELITSP